MKEAKASNNTITSVKDRELTVTRVFDARRELVFKAWTDPEHLPHWWGHKLRKVVSLNNLKTNQLAD